MHITQQLHMPDTVRYVSLEMEHVFFLPDKYHKQYWQASKVADSETVSLSSP